MSADAAAGSARQGSHLVSALGRQVLLPLLQCTEPGLIQSLLVPAHVPPPFSSIQPSIMCQQPDKAKRS